MIEDLDVVEEFYGVESTEYTRQVEAKFLEAFRSGVIRQA